MTPLYMLVLTLLCVGPALPGEPVCQIASNCLRIEEGVFEPADPENCNWEGNKTLEGWEPPLEQP